MEPIANKLIYKFRMVRDGNTVPRQINEIGVKEIKVDFLQEMVRQGDLRELLGQNYPNDLCAGFHETNN